MTTLEKKILSRIDKANHDYKMFEPSDRLLVAVSGGADSMALLNLLHIRLPYLAQDIQLCALYVDLGFSDKAEDRCHTMSEFFRRYPIEFKIERTTIGPTAHSSMNLENPCFVCSRIRRKKIFEAAETFGCRKIVFGHHKNDVVETFLMNMLFNRELGTMPPNLATHQGKYHIIRPLLYVEESLIKKYCSEMQFPIFDQLCPTDGSSQRQYIKELLRMLQKDIKGAQDNIFASMQRVKPDYLLKQKPSRP